MMLIQFFSRFGPNVLDFNKKKIELTKKVCFTFNFKPLLKVF